MGGRPNIVMPAAPAPPPDFADQAVRDAGAAERRKQLTSSSRRKSFLGGLSTGGGTPSVPVAAKSLLGV